MKRILLSIVFALVAFAATAQPRAIGARVGVTGLEADYQHDMFKNQFLQGNLGLDYGVLAKSQPGIKATAIYNFIWARPAWTDQGTWALYAGPGVTLGYVADKVTYKNELTKINTRDHGFMFALAAQAGIEYNFDFPLQLAADIRPYIGLHVGQKAGFYGRGLLGLIPTLSARYRF